MSELSGKAASVAGPARFPEQEEAEERQEDVTPEHHAGVAGGEVVRGDHLVDVPDRGTPAEAGQRGDDADAQSAIRTEGHEAHHGKSEAGPTDLGLERALFPADELCRHITEENVTDEVVEKTHTDAEEEEPTQHGLGGTSGGSRRRGTQNFHAGDDQAKDGEGQGEIGERESDERGHGNGLQEWGGWCLVWPPRRILKPARLLHELVAFGLQHDFSEDEVRRGVYGLEDKVGSGRDRNHFVALHGHVDLVPER